MADINAIAEQIQGLTLLEASQLVKMLEEKLGVSAAAAAPVMVAGGGAAAADRDLDRFAAPALVAIRPLIIEGREVEHVGGGAALGRRHGFGSTLLPRQGY